MGITLLLTMFTAVAVVAWRSRASPDPMRRSLAAACLAMVLFFAFVGLTAEYLFFAGVSQEFAMLLGLFSASTLTEAAAQREERPTRPETPPLRTTRPIPSSQT